MPLITDSIDAIFLSGMLPEHAKAFQTVSNETNCVIAIRTVGSVLTELLATGYATKSFGLKVKSCSWGPAAGFVCGDPRLSKNIITTENIHDQRTTMMSSAFKEQIVGFIPIQITTRRLKNLVDLRLIFPHNDAMTASGEFVEWDFLCDAFPPGWKSDQPPIVFRLVYNQSVQLWKIKYSASSPSLNVPPPDLIGYARSITQSEDDDVLGIVDAACPPHLIPTFLCATIGDYDLFFVLPSRSSAQEHARLDRRKVLGSSVRVATPKDFSESMDPYMGNTTPRVEDIIRRLNYKIKYRGGTIVHHGDEAGRPEVKKIDLPMIAFVPQRSSSTDLLSPTHGALATAASELDSMSLRSPTYVRATSSASMGYHEDRSGDISARAKAKTIIENFSCFYTDDIEGFKTFLSLISAGFILDLNPGWWRELQLVRSVKGAWEV